MSRLAAALQKETQLVSRLCDVLRSEREILIGGNADMLETVTQEKSVLLGEIAEATRQREAIIAPPLIGNAALTAWLTGHPEEKAAASAWEELVAVTRQAKEAHENNGLLLDALIRKTNEALVILTQHQRDHSLYGRDGQTAGGFGRRIIDSA